MSIHEFVRQLEDQHIELRVADGQVKVLAAKNVLSPELLQQLRSRKDELLSFLSSVVVPQPESIQPIEEQEHYAVSGGQKRIWISEQLDKDGMAYIITRSCVLEEKVNVEALEGSLKELIRRHESLRTCFVMVDGEVRQRVVEEVGFGLELVDLRGEGDMPLDPSASLRTAQGLDTGPSILQLRSGELRTLSPLRQIEEEEVSTPFDLEKAPLMRARLVRMKDDSYVFLLSMHHIISDAWSMEILMNQLMELYRAWSLIPDFNSHVQYKDYTAWQHRCIAEGRWQKSFDHWKNVLQELTDTKLPVTVSSSAKNMSAISDPTADTSVKEPSAKALNANYEFQIDQPLTNALTRLGKENSSSLFMVLLAMVQLLLYRYTGKTNLLTGVPAAGRNYRELFNLVGFFVNVLPFKTSFSTTDAFTTLLEQVKTALLLCLEHQDYPFDEVISNTSFPTAGGRMSVFNIVVDYNKDEGNKLLNDAASEIYARSVKNKSGKFDFVFSFTETAQGLEVDLEYNTQLYDLWFVKQLAEHLKLLMIKVIADPTASVAAILPFSNEEIRQLTEEYNNTSNLQLSNKTVKEIFEQVVELYGRRTALVDHGLILNYEELNIRANQLAHHICFQKKPVPDQVIVVFMERSGNFIISTLAIVKTGAAYLYIDVEYPEERIAYLLQDVSAVLIISDSNWADKIRSIAGNIPVILADDAAISDCTTSNPAIDRKPIDLAYIMYTSGSTGLPKGVMLEDRGVVRLAKDVLYINFSAEDSLVLGGAVSFDAIILEMWPVLLNGGTLHLLLKDELLNTAILKSYLSEHRITSMFFTTSWFNQLIETDINLLSPLKKLMVGGEKLSARHIRQAKAAFPHIQLVNAYGPTENTVVSTAYIIDDATQDNIPIGRPITNSEVYIVNNEMQPAPMGVWGQIIVSGDGLARGYLNKPELTETKFIRHPFKQDSFAYTTGDAGRWLPGGYIEYMARMDEQLKIRGFRIEPGEIENTMLLHPDVRLAVVLINEKEGQKELVAFYTGAANSADLRSLLLKQLPSHMIPSRLIQLKELPLNASGKADRKSLLEMVNKAVTPSAPQMQLNKLHERMLAIWEKVLQLKPIGINDNFFEIGGHSLKAMQLMSEVYKQLGVRLTLGDVFAHPTIEELCALAPGEEIGEETISPAPVQDYYELSHAQLRLWISSQYSSAKHAFNMPGVYELRGTLDVDAFNKSLHAITERHEILRTAFMIADGRPKQKILLPGEMSVAVNVQDINELNLNHLSLDEWIHSKTEELFDLSQPPLFRVHLLQIEHKRSLLIFVLHHIISDEWSTRVFIQGFARLYNAFASGNTQALPPLTIQYKDYAYWHNNFLSSSNAEKYKQYWKSRFEGMIPVLKLPADKPRPAIKTYNGSRHSIVFSRQEALKLEKIAQAENVTPYILLLTIFKTLFVAYTRQTDIIVGVLSAARSNASLQDQIGFYINNLPIRSRINMAESFISNLREVKTNAVEAFNHQLYPFDLIVENSGIQHQPDRSPLFDVMIQLLHEGAGVDEDLLQGISISEKDINFLQTRYDLEITLLHTSTRILCEIKYNTDIYARPTIVLLGERLKFLVRRIIADPLQTVQQLASVGMQYFPSPMEEAAVYHPSLNYLFWSEKLMRFFAGGSGRLNLPMPPKQTPHHLNEYPLDAQNWSGMSAIERWILSMSAIGLVFHKYGYDKILLASLPEISGRSNFLFFESNSQNDAASLIYNFTHQYEEGNQYGEYSLTELTDHLLLNNICNSQQLFELGVGSASLHATNSSIENFRLLLLLDDTNSDYSMKVYFDPSQYDTIFIDQLIRHFLKAADFLRPVFSNKPILQL